MSERIAEQSGDTELGFKDPSLTWIIGFLLIVSFLGLFSVVPLRKIMIIDFKLTYPSGTATAFLINSFHTIEGAKLANNICWSWDDLPTHYNVSVLLGGILSWGIMWPLLETRKGPLGYVTIAVASIVTLPHIVHELKWYYVLVIYIFAPTLAFCNAYGCGLTDWSLASTYGKLAIFTIGAWAGSSHGGVLAGLAACGVMMNIVSTASDLTQDFKTGYLTLASPRSMFVSQVIGTAMGCVISPCVFWLFYKAFDDLGLHGSKYPAPFAIVFRNMAKLGVEGFSSLPKDCLFLCYVFFGAAILINLIKDYSGKMGRFIPLPMAMAIPFYIGPYFAIDMCLGSLILFVWEKINKAQAEAFGPAVASGLICGDGIWTLPSSILALAGVQPPICMKFLSRGTNTRVDKFLGS
ncbi:hypothetical protein Dsin_032398 [Dipteronia sinensis]|uniref:Uncharacterized protein n=1 Tax=Dipteronia sinensis TaxID=43782 RepID=A0AAD9ZNB0_9ROSI|nr:hypothetical protein Dsin_032398 [Dipteronia sinensis]